VGIDVSIEYRGLLSSLSLYAVEKNNLFNMKFVAQDRILKVAQHHLRQVAVVVQHLRMHRTKLPEQLRQIIPKMKGIVVPNPPIQVDLDRIADHPAGINPVVLGHKSLRAQNHKSLAGRGANHQ
jgi:hypothetical protein